MSNKLGPTLSVLFLAFNQSAFVEEAAMSVLNQQCPEPIEILLSDDASDDATFKILQMLVDRYRGPHEVRLFRNQKNLGIGAHFNSLIGKSTGQLLISAAGDDISMPNRIHRILQAWEETNRRVDLIASDLIDLGTDGQLGGVIQVDDLSKWRNASEWAHRRPFVAGAGQAFTRRLCKQFGEFLPNVVCEDQVNTLRAILGGGAVTISEPLVQYRRGGISSGSATSDAASFLAKARVRHQRDLAEIQQMLQDAALMGEAKNIRNALKSRSIGRNYWVNCWVHRNNKRSARYLMPPRSYRSPGACANTSTCDGLQSGLWQIAIKPCAAPRGRQFGIE